MVELGALSRLVVAGAAVAVLGGCEMRGLVGSNSDIADGGGSSTSGAVGESSGVITTVSDEEGESTHVATSAEESGEATTEDVLFDVGFFDVPASCEAPSFPPCDERDSDPWHALGINCPGSGSIDASYSGDPKAMLVKQGMIGTSGVFTPREGERVVILSTGDASHLPRTTAELMAPPISCSPLVACPSTAHGGVELSKLPEPLDVRRVSDEGVDCTQDPGLVGGGDCSNTLWEEWIDGDLRAVDYAELRMITTVPEGADGIAYDFAFFSAEYPSWVTHGTPYNDMYIAWLESERWTGNISFDEMGNPITANGVFLDYKDAPSAACPGTCEAPELSGFSMDGHAGTKWLETTAPVQQGEKITMVFAIFDMVDGFYDSAVILDNFEWTCSDAPPFTAPAG